MHIKTPVLLPVHTTLRKGFHGWKAQTQVKLEAGDLVLDIYTMKNSNGYLVSRAIIQHEEAPFLSHLVFQDYSELVVNSKPARVTSKIVEDQHTKALTFLEGIMSAINVQYSL